eukprot:TRINITY_DN374_c0_g2_i1.p1 TRINITY_DN374_c0_g2~~TRINITY_DN374_c0_g2_i1.p1  ORF type:complete len:590 (-),score=204.69 TRINITY_DN374_c0_g2_i1:306-2075(-)
MQCVSGLLPFSHMMNALRGGGGNAAAIAAAAAAKKGVRCVSWNIAAVNNNPFEYWLTMESEPKYALLMEGVELAMDSPGAIDVPVGAVFDRVKALALAEEMKKAGWEGVDEVMTIYDKDMSLRRIISGFLKDKSLGDKRLASMPDRVTNTINVVDGAPVCRPTVINNYRGAMGSIDEWWGQWKKFMFEDEVTVITRSGVAQKTRVCNMLEPIKSAKYPAVTADEERLSLPLQTLCQAIFDAVLVHLMSVLSPDGSWQSIKNTVIQQLYINKTAATISLLEREYGDADVIFLQEASANIVSTILKHNIGKTFSVFAPAALDGKRDQNSLILLRTDRFNVESVKEVTEDVLTRLPKGAPIAVGDVFALTVSEVNKGDNKTNDTYMLASFHGDTNGLATIPVVNATHESAQALSPSASLVMGIDANCYLAHVQGRFQGATEFVADNATKGLNDCWSSQEGGFDASKCLTTCNARTYLQPQLNKAVKSTDKFVKGDINPKDFIIFYDNQFTSSETKKCNTAKRGVYTEHMCFPTMEFPSDHGVIETFLVPKDKVEASKTAPKPTAATTTPIKPSATSEVDTIVTIAGPTPASM